AHLSTPWRLVARRAAALSGRCGDAIEVGPVLDRTGRGPDEITLSHTANLRQLGRILIKCPSTHCPGQRQEGVFRCSSFAPQPMPPDRRQTRAILRLKDRPEDTPT